MTARQDYIAASSKAWARCDRAMSKWGNNPTPENKAAWDAARKEAEGIVKAWHERGDK